MRCITLEKVFREGYYKLGITIGRRPLPFILVPLILTIVLSTGMMKFTYIQDADYLYNPTNSRTFLERETIDELFPMNKSRDFDPGRITRLGKFGWIFIYPQDGGSILRRSIFDSLLLIDETIKNISFIWKGGERLSYNDVCAKWRGNCFDNVVLSLNERIKDIERKRSFVKYPILLNKETYSYKFYAANLADVKEDDLGYVVSAKTVKLMYFLNDEGDENLNKAIEWETAFLKEMKVRTYPEVTTYIFAASSVEREIHRTVLELIPYYILLALVMLTFCVLCMMTDDWVRSKPWLGVSSTVSVGMAILSSVGFIMYCGFPFIDLVVAIPFLLLGIGLDDTFVMIAAWKRTHPSNEVEKRVGESLSHASVSITITSLTNFFSFMFGFMTPFPSIHTFCAFASTGIIFTYLFQIFFFTGTLSLCGMAEEKRLHSLFCVRIKPPWNSSNKHIIHRLLCYTSDTSDFKEDCMMVFFRDIVSYYLSLTSIKVAILLSYICYLSFAIWGCLHLNEGTELQLFVPYDSYASSTLVRYFTDYGQYRDRIQLVIPVTLNYADPSVRSEIEEMLTKLEASPHIAESDLTESWLRHYTEFQKDGRASFYFTDYNMSKKSDYLHALRNLFLRYPPAERFASDIIFNENYTEIVASRFLVQTKFMRDFNHAKFVLQDLRNNVRNSSFPVYMSHFFFSFYDQFLSIGSICRQTLLTCACIMLLLITLFIPDIRCFIAAAINLASIEAGIIGYMALWNVNLDTVSMMILTMCIGFTVDYVAHMASSYLSSGCSTNIQRLKTALHSVGMPIVLGSITTILGVVVILVCPNYIFLCFFKVVFLSIVISAYHSVFLLPLLFIMLDSVIPEWMFTVPRRKAEPSTGTISEPINNGKTQEEHIKLYKTEA